MMGRGGAARENSSSSLCGGGGGRDNPLLLRQSTLRVGEVGWLGARTLDI